MSTKGGVMRICRASLLCCLFVLVAGSAFAATTIPTQFFDQDGQLITNQAIGFRTANAKGSLPPEADGTYDVPVAAGEEITFQVGEPKLGTGSVHLKVPHNPGSPMGVIVPLGGPPNDDCPNGQPVTVPSLTPGTTIGAATDGVAACGGQSQTSPGVWYVVTGTGTILRASTCPGDGASGFDTKIMVYCRGCTNLLCVGGNDDGGTANGCAGFTSRVDFCSQAGNTYRILVSGFSTATGNFNLSVNHRAGVPTACTATIDCTPPPPTGACCVTNEPPFEQGETPVTCTTETTTDCAAAGGVFQGENVECINVVGSFDYQVNPNVPIPDNNPAGVNSTINVPDSFVIADANVDIGITHTWQTDLIVEVTSPSGTTVNLWNQPAPCTSTDNINATADDSGTVLSCTAIGAGPINSTFYPPTAAGGNPLALFNGENAFGTWTFNVSDNWQADTGTLNQWSLHFLVGAGQCPAFDCEDDCEQTCEGCCDNGTACLECPAGTDGKVTICHFPPGNPSNRHTLSISPSALPAHCMNHGDTCGPCDDGQTQVAEELDTQVPATSNGPVSFGQAPATRRASRR